MMTRRETGVEFLEMVSNYAKDAQRKLEVRQVRVREMKEIT